MISSSFGSAWLLPSLHDQTSLGKRRERWGWKRTHNNWVCLLNFSITHLIPSLFLSFLFLSSSVSFYTFSTLSLTIFLLLFNLFPCYFSLPNFSLSISVLPIFRFISILLLRKCNHFILSFPPSHFVILLFFEVIKSRLLLGREMLQGERENKFLWFIPLQWSSFPSGLLSPLLYIRSPPLLPIPSSLFVTLLEWREIKKRWGGKWRGEREIESERKREMKCV